MIFSISVGRQKHISGVEVNAWIPPDRLVEATRNAPDLIIQEAKDDAYELKKQIANVTETLH